MGLVDKGKTRFIEPCHACQVCDTRSMVVNHSVVPVEIRAYAPHQLLPFRLDSMASRFAVAEFVIEGLNRDSQKAKLLHPDMASLSRVVLSLDSKSYEMRYSERKHTQDVCALTNYLGIFSRLDRIFLMYVPGLLDIADLAGWGEMGRRDENTMEIGYLTLPAYQHNGMAKVAASVMVGCTEMNAASTGITQCIAEVYDYHGRPNTASLSAVREIVASHQGYVVREQDKRSFVAHIPLSAGFAL
jgi:hypothetical protein